MKPVPSAVVTEVDSAWAAGFIDGEGSFHIRLRRENRSHVLVLRAAQTRLDPLVKLQVMYGGAVRSPKKRKDHHQVVYLWEIMGDGAVRAIRSMRPFLIVKPIRADVCLALAALRKPRGVNRVSEDEFAQREQLRAVLKRLNQRGVPSRPSGSVPQLRMIAGGKQ